MTRREKLIEDYEDALFALLMDEVAQMEGEEAMRLNEALLADPQYEVPEDVQMRCRKTVRNAFAQRRRKGISRSACKALRLAFVAAILAATLILATFAWAPKVRRITLNAIIDANRLYSEFRAGDDPDSVPDAVVIDGLEYYYNIALEWLPDGYYITYGNEFPDGTATIIYEDEEGNWIELYISSYGATIQVDTENAQIEETTIQNCPGWFIVKEIDYLPDIEPFTRRRIIWADDEKQIITDIMENDLSKEELIRLAEGVHWGGPK